MLLKQALDKMRFSSFPSSNSLSNWVSALAEDKPRGGGGEGAEITDLAGNWQKGKVRSETQEAAFE